MPMRVCHEVARLPSSQSHLASPVRHRDDDDMTQPEVDEIERRQANLRYLLNQWDPIGVSDLVSDEYDCLLAPLWRLLMQGASRAELSEFLWYDLKDHFGLDPEGCEVDRFADQLAALSATWVDPF